MADHPLRPATDRSLGRLLPHQLTNQAQARPLAPPLPRALLIAERMRYCHRFPGGIPHEWVDSHVLLTRPPLPLLPESVRLACVRHAASVYPEPGSNSPSMYISRMMASHHPQKTCCVFAPSQVSLLNVTVVRSMHPELLTLGCTWFADYVYSFILPPNPSSAQEIVPLQRLQERMH